MSDKIDLGAKQAVDLITNFRDLRLSLMSVEISIQNTFETYNKLAESIQFLGNEAKRIEELLSLLNSYFRLQVALVESGNDGADVEEFNVVENRIKELIGYEHLTSNSSDIQ